MSEILFEHTIVTPDDEGIAFDAVEDGNTFYENSLIKARELQRIVHCPVIADDSGICVDALEGAPGIFSSRYAGPDYMQGLPDRKKIPQDEQNRLLIEQLNNAIKNGGMDFSTFKNGFRSAHYTCSMVLYLGNDRLFVAQDTMEGAIVESMEKAAGNGGFGYDPIFFLPRYGKTAAELSSAEKNAISHRGKAARMIARILKSIG